MTDDRQNGVQGLSRPGGLTIRRGIGPLLLLTAIFFLNFFSRIVNAPLMPEIEADLGISHRSAGSLFFMISSGYFVALIGSGWVAARLTHRKTIILSTGVLGLALALTAFSDSLGSIRMTLLVVGLAAGLYLPSGVATLTDLIAFNAAHAGVVMPYFAQERLLEAEATAGLADPAYREARRAAYHLARVEGIDAALARIEDGSYGFCQENGEAIGLRRLEILPFAIYSVESQEQLEHARRLYPAPGSQRENTDAD